MKLASITSLRIKEQDRLYTYNVTLRRIRVAIVSVEKQKALHIVCVCVCVCVNLRIQHAMHMIRTVVCGLPDSIKFFHIISSYKERSSKKRY